MMESTGIGLLALDKYEVYNSALSNIVSNASLSFFDANLLLKSDQSSLSISNSLSK